VFHSTGFQQEKHKKLKNRCDNITRKDIKPLIEFKMSEQGLRFRKMFLHIFCYSLPNRSRDSSVGIATGYGLDGRGVGVRVPVGSRNVSSPHRPDRFWGPPNLPSNGYRVLSVGVKRLGCGADHLPPTSTEVKKMWLHTPTPPYAFTA
jgi:hypothetical protein